MGLRIKHGTLCTRLVLLLLGRGQLGAYGLTFRTQFNGFYSDLIYEVEDKPIMSMFEKSGNQGILVA